MTTCSKKNQTFKNRPEQRDKEPRVATWIHGSPDTNLIELHGTCPRLNVNCECCCKTNSFTFSANNIFSGFMRQKNPKNFNINDRVLSSLAFACPVIGFNWFHSIFAAGNLPIRIITDTVYFHTVGIVVYSCFQVWAADSSLKSDAELIRTRHTCDHKAIHNSCLVTASLLLSTITHLKATITKQYSHVLYLLFFLPMYYIYIYIFPLLLHILVFCYIVSSFPEELACLLNHLWNHECALCRYVSFLMQLFKVSMRQAGFADMLSHSIMSHQTQAHFVGILASCLCRRWTFVIPASYNFAL